MSRAGLWSVRRPRFAWCSGPIGLRLDYAGASWRAPTVVVLERSDGLRQPGQRNARQPRLVQLNETSANTLAESPTDVVRIECYAAETCADIEHRAPVNSAWESLADCRSTEFSKLQQAIPVSCLTD
jgi:hypothetical protein